MKKVLPNEQHNVPKLNANKIQNLNRISLRKKNVKNRWERLLGKPGADWRFYYKTAGWSIHPCTTRTKIGDQVTDVPSTDFDPNSRDVDESHRPGPDNVIAPPSTFHDPSKGINQETYPVTLQTMEYAVKFKTLRPPQNYLLLLIHIRHPSQIQTSKPRTNLRNTQHFAEWNLQRLKSSILPKEIFGKTTLFNQGEAKTTCTLIFIITTQRCTDVDAWKKNFSGSHNVVFFAPFSSHTYRSSHTRIFWGHTKQQKAINTKTIAKFKKPENYKRTKIGRFADGIKRRPTKLYNQIPGQLSFRSFAQINLKFRCGMILLR